MSNSFVIYDTSNSKIFSYGSSPSLPSPPSGSAAAFVSASEIQRIFDKISEGFPFNENPEPFGPYFEAYYDSGFVNIASVGGGVMPEPPDHVLAELYRDRRNGLLLECDWTQLPDVALTTANVSAFATYRQALRDVPQQAGFPGDITWPVRPSETNA